MNILLWTLQVLLALHTVIGAVWKFTNSAEQTMPTLKAIPHGIWLSMSVFELLIGIALVIPVIYYPLAVVVPIAAICIVAEMLLFSGLHLNSGSTEYGPIGYWLVVAATAAFIAYGRFMLSPF